MSNKRANKFHGNVPAWLSLAEIQIDYFSQFVKAWIPFNDWFSTTYQRESTDRDILERIKNETNPFRDKIITNFRLNDSDSIEFRILIGKLHIELEKNNIPSVENRISFTQVITEKNTLPKIDKVVKGFKIIIKYNHSAPKGAQRINIQVIQLEGYTGKMNWNQNEWNLEELKSNSQFLLNNILNQRIKQEIQSEILSCYHEINPLKARNLVVQPQIKSKNNPKLIAPVNCTLIDNDKHLYFINEPETIAKGLIEILYNLRNALFHGEVNPSQEVQKIYKEAYLILLNLIKSLN